jgi:hypothetical protein
MPANEILHFLMPFSVMKHNKRRKQIMSHKKNPAPDELTTPNINRCRVRRLGPSLAQCVVDEPHCRHAMPFGNLCGHPWVDQIADA